VSRNNYSRWAIDSREKEEAYDEAAPRLSSKTISRGRARKLTGAAILGRVLSIFMLADDAEADNRQKRRERRQWRRH
jgi:hypothetical protein